MMYIHKQLCTWTYLGKAPSLCFLHMDIFHLKSEEFAMYNKATYNCFLRLFTTRNIYYHIAQVQPLPHWDSVLSIELHDSAGDILENLLELALYIPTPTLKHYKARKWVGLAYLHGQHQSYMLWCSSLHMHTAGCKTSP